VKPVLGISAFGLKDCVAQPGVGCRDLGFYPASAVLPTTPFGRILTGDEAYKERTHAGLPWPPEARIQLGEPVRRSPIAAVWRSLVESGDRMVRWNAGHGLSFSLARILASHIKGLIAGAFAEEDCLLTGSGNVKSPMPVVAIPDHLDEFGQELLRRELYALECPEVELVWRPVAAALCWLNKVEGDLPRRMSPDDHIHVIYLGPDALEFTTFRLRVKEHNNQYYVLPLRDRPKNLLPLTGVDWAGRLIEESFSEVDEGAFWQAFIQFPEIWQALSGQQWSLDDLPRPWSRSQEWTLWNPPSDIYRRIYDATATSCVPLRRVLSKSCELNSHEDLSGSVGEVLRNEVNRMANLFPEGRLRGMIVCGPLAPRTLPPWLSSELDLLSSRRLSVEGELAEPDLGRLWLCADCEDPIAEGAAIYGRKILDNIPSYLDTMPQLSILAQEGSRFVWVPLLKAAEVLGGEEHKDRIERRFQLDAGKRNLHVYLHRGAVEESMSQSLGPSDPQSLSLDGISPCQARLVREFVRRLGSLEAVNNQRIFPKSSREALYARNFAEVLFTTKDTKATDTQEPSPLKTARNPLRRAIFDFPSTPERDTVLDIEVRIRPASGLAKIEIIPEDSSFLQGDRVLLNYSTMRAASKLPSRMRGWPSIEELIVDPEDYVLLSREMWVKTFERTPFDSRDYIQVLDGVKRNVLTGTTPKLGRISGRQLYIGSIDQDGHACTKAGNEIIHRIALKCERDFQQLQSSRQTPYVRGIIKKVISRAGWLYKATPPSIISHIRKILTSEVPAGLWRSAVEAAGRAFWDVEDFRTLFRSIIDRSQNNELGAGQFTEYAGRSICRVLMFRSDGYKGLDDRRMAQSLAHRAVERLLQEQHKREPNFGRVYFQMIQLLLYLLRYRKTDSSCFDPSIPQSISVFEEAKKSMEAARKSFPRASTKAAQIQKIMNGFESYLHYEGTEEMLPHLRDLAEGES
jgi:hypothetical protein